jgi:hypothetical protein
MQRQKRLILKSLNYATRVFAVQFRCGLVWFGLNQLVDLLSLSKPKSIFLFFFTKNQFGFIVVILFL